MNCKLVVALGIAAAVFTEANAQAHVAAAAGPWFANATQELVFGIGHGCSGADTYRLKVDIPAGVTAVRPMASDFGKPTVSKDAAGAVTSVTWQKADADALDEDLAYYKLVLKVKTPDKPFTTLYFAAHQTCRAKDGTLTTVEWVGLPGDPVPDGGKAAEPAAAFPLLPTRAPGWNQYTVPVAMADLSAYFKDASIVWKGAQAYSANANTQTQIKATAGASALTALSAGDVIWVKY